MSCLSFSDLVLNVYGFCAVANGIFKLQFLFIASLQYQRKIAPDIKNKEKARQTRQSYCNRWKRVQHVSVQLYWNEVLKGF